MTEIQAPAKKSSEVAIEIMGKAYQVPEGLTMLQAMWHTGHALTRGVGCLGGICGACSASYRTKGDIRIKNGLACQTQVEEGMSFSLIYSYYPSRKVAYDFEDMEDPKQALFKYYPEAALCRNCDSCTVACPKGIDVRAAVWQAAFGDYKSCAEQFLPCVMCSLCVPVCIADIAPNQVGLFVRRAQGIYFEERPKALSERIEEIEAGHFDTEWDALAALSDEGLMSYPISG